MVVSLDQDETKSADDVAAPVGNAREESNGDPADPPVTPEAEQHETPIEKVPEEAAAEMPASPEADSSDSVPSTKDLKDKIMATTATDYTEPMTSGMTEAVSDMQDRSKAAYDKSSEIMTEMSDFTKGTAEAMVESTKVLAGAMQDMGKTYASEAKSAYEQMTADLKEMAAIKSPTELFQLQGKIMRRNFDALVSTTSKNAEMLMKLSNDAFAPISARMNVAAEKISKIS